MLEVKGQFAKLGDATLRIQQTFAFGPCDARRVCASFSDVTHLRCILALFLLSLALGCAGASDSPQVTPTLTLAPPTLMPTATPLPTRLPATPTLPTNLVPEPIKNLADVFPPRDFSHSQLDPTRLRVIVATGDVVPARHTDMVIRARNNDFGSLGIAVIVSQ
jgi:hypothetical protein